MRRRLCVDVTMVKKADISLVFYTRSEAWSRGFAATSLVKSLWTIPFRRLPYSYPRAMETSLNFFQKRSDVMKKRTQIVDSSSTDLKQVKNKDVVLPKQLQQVNLHAAGIDIGATAHFVAVSEGSCEQTVREFKSFTPDLYELARWLKDCGVNTVAMESTGVYWIPIYELLELQGFEVKLVDARQVKNVSGRKSDVKDCQWIQQLHTYGLLNGAFRPAEEICALRAYVRQRSMLIEDSSRQILHMQKALMQMNLQLHHVVSDITGVTGMKIIRSIVGGIRDPKLLALNRDRRCKESLSTIEAALVGHYRAEHLFSLQQALELYDIYMQKILDCDQAIQQQLSTFSSVPLSTEKDTIEKPSSKNGPLFNLSAEIARVSGVDLTEIPGINSLTALSLIGEIGLDMSKWKDGKQFASWLGLCPGTKISGGKVLSSRTKACANRAATALRIAANTLYRSKTALGAYLRRLKMRLGPMKAITATAHKLALIVYNMLKLGIGYKEAGQEYYETQYKNRMLERLKRQAQQLGYDLIEKVAAPELGSA